MPPFQKIPEPNFVFFFFFSSSISSTQIVIPGMTAGGVRTLWVSEHPLWWTRYFWIFLSAKCDIPNPRNFTQNKQVDVYRPFWPWKLRQFGLGSGLISTRWKFHPYYGFPITIYEVRYQTNFQLDTWWFRGPPRHFSI